MKSVKFTEQGLLAYKYSGDRQLMPFRRTFFAKQHVGWRSADTVARPPNAGALGKGTDSTFTKLVLFVRKKSPQAKEMIKTTR